MKTFLVERYAVGRPERPASAVEIHDRQAAVAAAVRTFQKSPDAMRVQVRDAGGEVIFARFIGAHHTGR